MLISESHDSSKNGEADTSNEHLPSDVAKLLEQWSCDDLADGQGKTGSALR